MRFFSFPWFDLLSDYWDLLAGSALGVVVFGLQFIRPVPAAPSDSTSTGTQPAPGQTLRRSLAWQKVRHQLSLVRGQRKDSHFTGFLRLPTQFDVLGGPVVELIARGMRRGRRLEILVVGCSQGAEAYTVASVLTARHPELDFRIRAYDLDADCIRYARAARYTPEDVYINRHITEAFVRSTFDENGGPYTVKPHIASRVEFEVGNVLDGALFSALGSADLIMAQNVLFHLSRAAARQALQNLLSVAHPGSVLFLDGVDLDVRQRFTRKAGLVPLDFAIPRIHDEARWARAAGWPYSYWGLEPFRTYKHDWKRRYATIFFVPPASA